MKKIIIGFILVFFVSCIKYNYDKQINVEINSPNEFICEIIKKNENGQIIGSNSLMSSNGYAFVNVDFIWIDENITVNIKTNNTIMLMSIYYDDFNGRIELE